VAGFETGANDELDVYTNNDLSACTPLPSNGNAIVSVYAADVISAQDYAPFGMEMWEGSIIAERIGMALIGRRMIMR
jgi:hypothetical protein